MNVINALVTLTLCALFLPSLAHGQVELNSVRVGAKDSAALAKFYEAAFGMSEVNEIKTPMGPEVFLNFGATTEAAKANTKERVVIAPRDSDDLKDAVAHLIFTVKDMSATVAAIKTAGGSMAKAPYEYGNTHTMIGIAVDPVGNRIELIQRP